MEPPFSPASPFLSLVAPSCARKPRAFRPQTHTAPKPPAARNRQEQPLPRPVDVCLNSGFRGQSAADTRSHAKKSDTSLVFSTHLRGSKEVRCSSRPFADKKAVKPFSAPLRVLRGQKMFSVSLRALRGPKAVGYSWSYILMCICQYAHKCFIYVATGTAICSSVHQGSQRALKCGNLSSFKVLLPQTVGPLGSANQHAPPVQHRRPCPMRLCCRNKPSMFFATLRVISRIDYHKNQPETSRRIANTMSDPLK